MYNVTMAVNHDVSIVPVLDLQDVARHRVRRHGFDKVQAGSFEGDSIDRAILVDKVLVEIVDLCSTHLVP